jgi:hypothetical protein
VVVAEALPGRRVPVRMWPEPARAALAWLGALANQWDERLDALQAHLGREASPG